MHSADADLLLFVLCSGGAAAEVMLQQQKQHLDIASTFPANSHQPAAKEL
jgi:hypothetical protein